MRRMIVAIGLLAVLAAACSPDSDQETAPETAPDTASASAAPSPTTTPSSAPTSGSEPTEDIARSACEPADRDEIDAAVGGQLDAFAADDYERALTFASNGFRLGLDAEAFRELITQGFPVVADDASHTTQACFVVGDDADPQQAQALVEVEGSSGERIELVYILLREDDAWRIGGAQPVGAGSGDEGIVA